jgi:hypothetical protein
LLDFVEDSNNERWGQFSSKAPPEYSHCGLCRIDNCIVLHSYTVRSFECPSIERSFVDLVVFTSIAALVRVASGVLAFLVWLRQQVDAARQENADDLRTFRRELYEQLRRELSAELRAGI